MTKSLAPKSFTIPQIMLIAGTRAALGAGVAMLIADRVDRKARRGAGWSLLAVGVLTTVPLLMSALGKPPVRQPAKTLSR